MKKNRSPVLVLFVCAATLARAQTYPAALVTQLTGPRTIFLDEYADPFQPRIKTTIYFTDFTESSWQFALRMKITGPGGIVIATKPGARPVTRLHVAPGQPYTLEGADLAFYFDYDNLTFAAITRQQLELDHRLPEGLYTFCFEAVDYESGRALSHPACATAYLSLFDPPVILSPQQGQVVENIAMQNILLQWQPGNITGNTNLNAINYQVDLYEVTGEWMNPVTAIANNHALPIWQSQPLAQNVFVYSNAEPPLEKGKRYVFTVRAFEVNGRGRFKNNGYSVPRYFRYGYPENDTILLNRPEHDYQFTLGAPSLFTWTRPGKALPTQMYSYSLRLVRVDSLQTPESAMLQNSPFFQTTYLATGNQVVQKTIPVAIWANISRMATYAWQVTAHSGTQKVAQSVIRTFTGPPEIESFIAGGFVMQVTRLDEFNKTNNTIWGRCATRLCGDTTVPPAEFSYAGIQLASIGNNDWVMQNGYIADRIAPVTATLVPENVPQNGPAKFTADSVFVNTSGLRLGGKLSWQLPHLNTAGEAPLLTTRRCALTLANVSFLLAGSAPAALSDNHESELLEPFGFKLRLAQASAFSVYQSKYTASFSGFVELPRNVVTLSGTPANIAFAQAPHLFDMHELHNENSEAIAPARGTAIELQPLGYHIDLNDTLSPGDRAQQPGWKGVHIGKARLIVPPAAENTGQITMQSLTSHTIINTPGDTVTLHIDPPGLQLNASAVFGGADSLRFNTFVSTQATFFIKTSDSYLVRAGITGSLQVPVIDTLKKFAYVIALGEEGFSEGYLVNGLAGTSFTFNPGGSTEQRIKATIRRAVFRGRNRIEMDLDLHWTHFSLTLTNVQRFSAWGNHNIGFDVPNGRFALIQQAQGKASGFDITVDRVGCGRSGNVYAFGASAAINMDESVSGENGPPLVNVYSIYRNPLLTGSLTIPLSSLQDSLTAPSGTLSQSTQLGSTAAGYSAAIGAGMGDALAQLHFNPGDTITVYPPGAAESIVPLVQGHVITQVGMAIDIIYRLKPFIKPDAISDRDWLVLDRLRKAIANDVVQQTQVTNARGLLNFVLNKVADGLIAHVNHRVEQVAATAIGKVRAAINGKITDPVTAKINEGLSAVFSKLEATAVAQAGEEHRQAITETFSLVQTSIAGAIRNAVHNSFEVNITAKLDRAIHACVVSKINGFVRGEVKKAGAQLLGNSEQGTTGLQQIFANAGSMFGEVADTVRDVIMAINGPRFVNTAESLVEDAITGIDWNAVAAQVTAGLIQKGLTQVLATQLTGHFAENAGAYAAAVLSVVKFDFSNLGEKLQNGQLDQVVKFDPTNIYIVSPAVDVRGQVVFTKDDPVYGDSWQASVMVRVKIPKKDNPIECTGFFINGKTTQGAPFTYWLVRLGVSGLNIPLSPVPLVWDGAEGHFYSHMKKNGTAVTPDASGKFGVGCQFTFFDQQSSGATLLLALGAQAQFDQEGFAIELTGNASMLNFQKQGGKYVAPGFVTGTGTIGYYKNATGSQAAGNFNVQLNTQPILCAGGNAGFQLRTPSDWRLWVGSKQNPFGVKLLCKNFLQNTAYFDVSNTGLAAGIMANVSLNARSPWLEFAAIKVRGYATFALGYNVSTAIVWEPSFAITEASVSAWVSAAIGVDYETAGTSGSLTLAGVSLAGQLSYKSQPQSELHGGLSGSITVIGFTVGFETPVHYSLSEQKILD